VGLFDGNAIKSDDIIARTLAHELAHYLANLGDHTLHNRGLSLIGSVLPDWFLFAPDGTGVKRFIQNYQGDVARSLNPATPDANH
jgi:hypothetical protein